MEVNDLFVYRSMTAFVQDGMVPYHDWVFEYPPLAIVPIALGGIAGVGEREYAIAFQAERDAPFSIWGLWDLPAAQRVVQAGAVILAVGLAVVPRRHDLAGLCALCAAVLIALQLAVDYWFYLYLVWFFPLVMLAVLARRSPSRPSTA